MTQRPIVFLGPSLRRNEAEAMLDAAFQPPAAQGDIYRATLQAPPAIALIDGIFKDSPTVRHREILWALSQGIPVFGASSMGALRAAELAPHGMIGVGLIYRWYRRFHLLPDDAVAVIHSPFALGAQPLSDALVDIRRSVSRARRVGTVPLEDANQIVAQAARHPFAERNLPAHLEPHRVSQKAEDARALLRILAKCQEGKRWPRPSGLRVPIVHAWLDDLRDSGLPAPE